MDLAWIRLQRIGRLALTTSRRSLGLVIAEKRLRGKGLGTEATALLVKQAFDQLNMHKVELTTRPDNEAMVKVAKNCGFKLEGRLRETVYFNREYHDGLLFGLIRNESDRAKRKMPS